MARKSAWDHLKFEVIAEFKEGLQPKDVYKKFPDIPGATIREWYKPFRPDFAQESAKPKTLYSSNFEESADLDPPSSNVIEIAQTDESDFELVRRILRSLIRDKQQPGSVRVQGCNALLRSIEIKYNMPPQKLDLFEEIPVDDLQRQAEAFISETA